MIRYKCTVAYDGGAYCGWQTQRTGDSVQEQIEAALQRILGEPVRILAAGRTDAGVNAWGQVFQFDTERDMTERKMMGAINGFLPPDIHIRKVEKKNQLFHARYCVRSKRYDYCINFGEYDVFSRTHAYQCPYRVDIERMKQGAQYLIGTHDFTSFNSNTLKETPDQVRTVESIEFMEDGDRLTISYRGRGFLRYMVRMMTAQLLDVGRGKLEPEDIRRILEARSKTIARRNAHPEGLTLMEINYFEVLAETDHLTVREVLPEDADALAGADTSYVLADRHTNAVYGTYASTEAEGILILWRNCGEELEQILNGLKQYEQHNGRTVLVKPEKAATPKPTAYIMIGLPAAGKTTLAETLPKAQLCSADEVRREWFGDAGLQYTEEFLTAHGIDTTGMSDLEKQRNAHPFVWAEVYKRAKEALQRGENIVVDGVNVTRKTRAPLMENAAKLAIIHGIWINTPVDVCLERDQHRERHAGEDTIRRSAAHFQKPSMEEGFDILEIYDQNGELVSRAVKE